MHSNSHTGSTASLQTCWLNAGGRLQDHGKVMRVVLSGEDLATLPTTLDCLTALNPARLSPGDDLFP